MIKLFAYVQFVLAALCFVVFALLAIAHPSPHGLLPTVIAALVAPLPFALPLVFGGVVFLSIHGYLYSLREEPRPRDDDEEYLDALALRDEERARIKASRPQSASS